MKKILIVGAGIAGCSAAISLAEHGAVVTLIEKQTAWKFQSSGIFIYSNGLKALQEIGVFDEIVKAGFPVHDGLNAFHQHDGEKIVDVFYPHQYGLPPIVGIKRAEMHRILNARLADFDIAPRLGVTVSNLENEGSSGVQVHFSDGTVDRFDLVIGADGIRSQVREFVAPGALPTYSGFGVWRSVHTRPSTINEKIMMMGTGKRLGIMPISADKLYIFGTIAEPEGQWYEPNSWPSEMRKKFSEFRGVAGPFLDQLDAHSEVLFTAVEEMILDRPWYQGRILLIGDAAHASTPFMGQGGTMAIEDAVVLGRLMAASNDIDQVLADFYARRAPRCKMVQDASRRVGQAGASEDQNTCLLRNDHMKKNAQLQVDQFFSQLTDIYAT